MFSKVVVAHRFNHLIKAGTSLLIETLEVVSRKGCGKRMQAQRFVILCSEHRKEGGQRSMLSGLHQVLFRLQAESSAWYKDAM